MNVHFTAAPDAADIDFIAQQINQETPECGAAPFAFFIRNDQGHIMAGCNGAVIFGSIYTDQIWVHPTHRRQGLGRTLMERVHAHGVAHGATQAALNCMSFQEAAAFYKHLGYVLDFQRPGYIKDASCLFFTRPL